MKRIVFVIIAFITMMFEGIAQDSDKVVTIYWDISMAMENRDIESDIAYLDTYFNKKDYTVNFKAFNTTIVQSEVFQVKNGNWKALKNELVNAIYDGTTAYSVLFNENTEGDYLIFTDGITAIDTLTIPATISATIINSTQDHEARQFNGQAEYVNIYNPANLAKDKTVTVSGNTIINQVSGIVSDETGPLEGVNVIIQDAQKGTVTNSEGFYSIKAKTGDVLVYNYLGKKAIRINVQDKNVINVLMNESNEGLDEVVISAKKKEEEVINTSYGKRSKKTLGYDVQTLSDDKLSKTATNVNQSIQGQLTGMSHTTNTDISKFTVRSLQTILGDVYGLIVVDGVPQAKSTSASGAGGGGFSADFSWLNPENIADITLLKSMAATNKYGTLGINGVLEITTKNGLQNRKGDPKDAIVGTTATYTDDTKMVERLPKTPYINALKEAKDVNEAYAIYLEQRDAFKNQFEFFIDVHDYFKGWGNKTISERVLDSAADINFKDVEALRALAYKYQETGNHTMATIIFERVKDLAPKESQSYRNLAQSYHYKGEHKKAFKLYHDMLFGNIPGVNFYGMANTLTIEYRNLISKHRSILDVSKTPADFLVKSPMDYRVVFEWNNLEAEFDMEVVNPQKRFFTLPHTSSGDPQRMKQEKAQGYGLEENFLTKDDKGTWLFNIDYKGNTKRNTPVFIKMTLFKNYGKPNETKEIQVFRFVSGSEKVTIAQVSI